MDDRAGDDVARGRWMAINAVRLSGVAMVLAGILIVQSVISAPEWAGYALLAVGLLDIFLMPRALARKWRSGPP